MLPKNSLIIAVDFDGTIVEDAYPKVGPARIFAFDTLIELQKKGHRLILWTYRYGERLQDAVDFCKKNGVEFYAVNQSYPEEKFDGKISRKINADVFIDDRNLGGILGWGEIYQQLLKTEKHPERKPKKGFFGLFKS
ncbi:MAG: hydrolase [Flavobacteriaceae bacterium]|nr:hydrolase [Flavobacteriaceae bacterium]